MSKYIHITKEQEALANFVDLEAMLRSKNESLKHSGSERLWMRHKGVTVRGNEWFSHYENRGGMAIDFVREFYGLGYPEAVIYLLNLDLPCADDEKAARAEKRFVLPEANRNMRRVYAYMMKTRCIAAEVITHFAHARLLYEDVKYHNAVFVGKDEFGVPRHAHKRSTHSGGLGFRGNVAGSDPRYSFHYVGIGSKLRVFEAPIDMFSFITLYPENWQVDSYVSLCGVSEHALLWMLAQNSGVSKIVLQLDNDKAGIDADSRLTEILNGYDYLEVAIEKPQGKDWNEDCVKAQHGAAATLEDSNAHG